jgi:hypothetical protein
VSHVTHMKGLLLRLTLALTLVAGAYGCTNADEQPPHGSPGHSHSEHMEPDATER